MVCPIEFVVVVGAVLVASIWFRGPPAENDVRRLVEHGPREHHLHLTSVEVGDRVVCATSALDSSAVCWYQTNGPEASAETWTATEHVLRVIVHKRRVFLVHGGGEVKYVDFDSESVVATNVSQAKQLTAAGTLAIGDNHLCGFTSGFNLKDFHTLEVTCWNHVRGYYEKHPVLDRVERISKPYPDGSGCALSTTLRQTSAEYAFNAECWGPMLHDFERRVQGLDPGWSRGLVHARIADTGDYMVVTSDGHVACFDLETWDHNDGCGVPRADNHDIRIVTSNFCAIWQNGTSACWDGDRIHKPFANQKLWGIHGTGNIVCGITHDGPSRLVCERLPRLNLKDRDGEWLP